MRNRIGLIGAVMLILIAVFNISTINTKADEIYSVSIEGLNDGKLYFPDTDKENVKLFWGYSNTDDSALVNHFKIKNNSASETVYINAPTNSYFNYYPLDKQQYFPLGKGESLDITVTLSSGIPVSNAKIFTEEIGIYSKKTGSYEKIGSSSVNNKIQMVVTVFGGFEVQANGASIIEGEKAVINPKINNGQTPYSYEIYTINSNNKNEILVHGTTDKAIESITVKPTKDTDYYVKVTDRFGSIAECKAAVKVEAALFKADISKQDIDFGSVYEDYTSIPDEVSFVISNKGNQPLTVYEATNRNFEIKGISEKVTLGVGEYVVMKAVPKGGLAKGTYADTVKFTTQRKGIELSIKLNYKVIEKIETLSVSPTSLDFGSTTEGYLQIPSAKTATVKNTGNTVVKVRAPSPVDFVITGFTSDIELGIGKSITFTVAPKGGLTGKNYSESIKIEDDKSSVNLTVSFKVAKAPTVKIDGTTTIKSGDSTTLNANVSDGCSPYKYKWSTGSEDKSIKVNPAEETSYSVTVTDANGISATADVTVGVNQPVKARIDGNTIVRSGESTTLTVVATEGVLPYKYSWSTGETSESIVCTPEDAKEIKVTVTDGLGSSAEAGVTVKVSEKAKKQAADSFEITTDSNDVDFGVVPNDYNRYNSVKWFKVINSGNKPVTFQSVSSASFDLSGIVQGTALAAGASLNISITPKDSLAPGNYSEDIAINTTQGSSLGIKANVIVDEKPASKPVSMNNDTITDNQYYDYGNGKLNFIFEKDELEDIVGIVDTAAIAEIMLDDEDKQIISDGKEGTIKIESLIMIPDEISERDKQIINDAFDQFRIKYPDIKIGKYIDINISKQIGEYTWESVSELNSPITMQLTIPQDIKEKGKFFYLFRLHEGVVEKLAEWTADDEEWQFNSDRFSTYIVAYSKVKEAGSSSGIVFITEKTYMNLIIILAVVLISMVMMIILKLKNKKKRHRK